jgi:ATP-dependent Clp protease ATP-binding subunit ClpC
MTSNAGAREISRDASLGFHVEEGMMRYEEIRTSALSEMKRLFNPEFINRVDETVVFHSLNREHLREILELMLKEIQVQLTEQNITLQITSAARTHLIEEGYDEKYGARPLRRTLQRLVEDPLSIDILKGRFKQGSTIVVDVKDKKIAFRSKRSRKSSDKSKDNKAAKQGSKDGSDSSKVPQELAVR